MRRTEQINVRLDPAERAALERAAQAEDRPQSAVIRRALIDWLRANGYLKEGRRK